MSTPRPRHVTGEDPPRGVPAIPVITPIFDGLLQEAQAQGALLDGVSVPLPVDLREPMIRERLLEPAPAVQEHTIRGQLPEPAPTVVEPAPAPEVTELPVTPETRERLRGTFDRWTTEAPTEVMPAVQLPESAPEVAAVEVEEPDLPPLPKRVPRKPPRPLRERAAQHGEPAPEPFAWLPEAAQAACGG